MKLFNKLGVSTAGILLGFATVGANSAQAADIVKNGGFATGDFTDWSVTQNGNRGCDSDWQVNATGNTGCRRLAVGDGNAAYNSFDGDGPQTFRLSQLIDIDTNIESAVLSWQDTHNIRISSNAQQREFSIDLFDSSGTNLIANLHSQLFGSGTHNQDWTSRSVDVTSILSAHEGQQLTLAFSNFIPQRFTGPAGFGLDSVSLEVAASESVPESTSLLGILSVSGIGAASFKRKFAKSKKAQKA